ncbi:MAG TPA: hypothetical protein VHR45_17545 [Thermoanaerobaculia bacterium]|nr:hypothetical protein [Thermoanaerobaculia bacterium]
MRRTTLLQTRVDPTTAARVRLEADRCALSVSEWIATALRRELLHAGAADALAAKSYEMSVTVGHMLRALMLDAMGPEATDRAVDEAADAAADEAAAALAGITEPAP